LANRSSIRRPAAHTQKPGEGDQDRRGGDGGSHAALWKARRDGQVFRKSETAPEGIAQVGETSAVIKAALPFKAYTRRRF